MSINFVKAILKDNNTVQWFAVRSIAATFEDMKTAKGPYMEMYELLKGNPVFECYVGESMEEARKLVYEVPSMPGTVDIHQVAKRSLLAAHAKTFMAGLEMGQRVASKAFSEAFDDNGMIRPQSECIEAKQVLDSIGKDVWRHTANPEEFGGEDGLKKYMARIATELFAGQKDGQKDDGKSAPSPVDIEEIVKRLNEKMPEGIKVESAHIASPEDVKAIMDKVKPSVKTCRCREDIMGALTPERLEISAEIQASKLPGVIADAIHARAIEMGLTGVVGAHEVTEGELGRGKLAAEIAKNPELLRVAQYLNDLLYRMFSHGAPITAEDSTSFIAHFGASLLTFAVTDMAKGPEVVH